MHKTHILTMIFILILPIIVGACNNKTDLSLPIEQQTDIRYLEKMVNDSVRAMNLNAARKAIARAEEIAKDSDDYYKFITYEIIVHFYEAQPDSMLAKIDQGMKYISRQSSTNPTRDSILIKCIQSKASYYAQFNTNFDSLIHYNQKACELAERSPSYDDRLLSYCNLADAYKQKGELAQSAFYYRKAIYLADSANTGREGYVPLYSGLADTYKALYDFQQSKIWWDKTHELWDVMMTHEQFNYLNNRGTDYYYQGDYKNCLNTFLQLDTFLQARPTLIWERHFCHANLIDAYLQMNMTAQADSLMESTFESLKQIQSQTILSYLYTQKMELAFQKGNINQVRELITKHPLSTDVTPEIKLIRLEFLQNFYTQEADWKNAFHYKKEYDFLNDSLRNERVRMRTADLQMQYERDATVLNQRIYINQKEVELMKTYTILAVSGLTVLLLIVLIYLHRKHSKLKEEQMLHRIVELRMENIRNRITPHFIYNALNHELHAQQQGKPTQLNTLVSLLRQEQALANVFCTSLKEEMDFIQLYVQIEGEALGNDFKYSIELEEGIEPENIKLPSMMVQIFVENAIKHGLKNIPESAGIKEKTLTLTIYKKDNSTYIEVRNNGNPLHLRQKEDKARTGLRVVSQTIQLLNEHNSYAMSYSLSDYQSKDGETGCCAQLIIPNHYNFNID